MGLSDLKSCCLSQGQPFGPRSVAMISMSLSNRAFDPSPIIGIISAVLHSYADESRYLIGRCGRLASVSREHRQLRRLASRTSRDFENRRRTSSEAGGAVRGDDVLTPSDPVPRTGPCSAPDQHA